MNKIINTQDALDAIDANVGILYDSPTLVTSLKKMVNKLPPVDAVPVRRGRWETDGMMMDDGEYLMTRCTACGEAYEYGYNMPFCPNCGAKMDGKGDGNETD